MLRISLGLVLVLTLAAASSLDMAGLVDVALAQQVPNTTDADIQVVPVQGNIYMLAGAGGNISMTTGFDGTLLVDAGRADMADKVLANVQQIAATVQIPFFPTAPCVGPRCPGGAGTGAYSQLMWSSQAVNGTVYSPGFLKPIRYVINTSLDADHTGGNARIAATGVTYTGGNVAREAAGEGIGAEVWAHEAVLNRMVEAQAPPNMQPRWAYYTPKYKWNGFFNGEGIELYHIPAAHTDGDTIVYFRYSDVISAGDVLATDRYPRIDIPRGGTIQGTIEGLNKILDIAVAQNKSQGGTYVIPGHGGICDTGDVVNYRNMVVKIHDRIQALIKSGMTLPQVKAARPTLDFDGRYGSPDEFIEATFRSLSEDRQISKEGR